MTICGTLPPISLVPGDKWDETVNIADENGAALDLSGWTIAKAEVRKRSGSVVVGIGDGTLVLDLSGLDEGKIRFTAAAGDTIGLPLGDRSELEIEGYPAGGSPADKMTLYFGPVVGEKIATKNNITVFHMGFQGVPGLSAYQLAVAQGFEGTIEEWLASLIGWTPVLAVVADGARRVHQVVDWIGSGADKPATGLFVGSAGLVEDIGDAADIRGGTGSPGAAATIEVDSVTTLAPGEPATVVNTGTDAAARLVFGIPQGNTGDQGPPGAAGEPLIATINDQDDTGSGGWWIVRDYHAAASFAHLRIEMLVGEMHGADLYLRHNDDPFLGPIAFDSDDPPIVQTGLGLVLAPGDSVSLWRLGGTASGPWLMLAQIDGRT